MIHHEGEIQTPKGSGVSVARKLLTLGRGLTKSPSRWVKCVQQVISQKDGLRIAERLKAIACVNPPLDSREEWGESVWSFLARNNVVCAVVANSSGRNWVVSGHDRRGFSYPTRSDRFGSFLT